MSSKHVTQYIEAYYDHRLSAERRQLVEKHLEVCPSCARRFRDAQRLTTELEAVMRTALGHPSPPPALRQRVRQALQRVKGSGQFAFPWPALGQFLNATGTLAVIVLLAVGAFVVIQGRLPGAEIVASIGSSQPSNNFEAENSNAASLAVPTPLPTTVPTLTSKSSILGDTLANVVPTPLAGAGAEIPTAPLRALTNKQVEEERSLQPEAQLEALTEAESRETNSQSKPPGGRIAFSFFNPAPNRNVYEIHLIRTDGSNHRIFPLDGVSEPALRRTENGHQLAYRAWSEPTSPRSLLSSNLEGVRPSRIGGFWEDAQPDWSPTESRLIFASQRESDRRWRLYTSWADGSAEKNLRREGKAPTFAPDGFRFAFESCDDTGNRCGLWVGNLDNSEYGSRPFLEDQLARSPDWSPVGEQIAYMANPDGNWDLFLVNSDGGDQTRLTADPAIDGLPAWSPDGEWLAFLSDRSGNWGIWVMHLASRDVHQVFSFDGGIYTPPQHSPYGVRNWFDEQLSWSR